MQDAENAQEEENSPLHIVNRNDAFDIVYNHKLLGK
jgi:hypothetical protein